MGYSPPIYLEKVYFLVLFLPGISLSYIFGEIIFLSDIPAWDIPPLFCVPIVPLAAR